MKTKSIILSILLVLANISLNAQNGFEIGFGGSFNSSWILNQNNARILEDCPDRPIQAAELAYVNTWGYTFGGSIGYKWKENLGFIAEINFTKAGQKYKDAFSSIYCLDHSNVERDVMLSYIQIPIMLKYNTKGRSKVKYFAMLGPELNFRISGSETVIIEITPSATSPQKVVVFP